MEKSTLARYREVSGEQNQPRPAATRDEEGQRAMADMK